MRGRITRTVAGAAALLVLAGCGTDGDTSDLPTREPATPAVAPVTTTAAAGQPIRFPGPVTALLAEAGSGALTALSADRRTMSIVDTTSRSDSPAVRAVALPEPAASLVQGAPGEVLAPAPGRILRIDIATAAVTGIPVEGDVRTVARREDGSLVAGTAQGRVVTLSAAGAVEDTVSGLVSADVVSLTPSRVVVLDRRQTSVTEIEPGQDRLGLALRAGDGASSMLSDHFGRVIVTDTDGGELLVYTSDPLVLRQRFPVGSSPYALAYDRRSETVWVTCTQSNEVVGFDLSTGIPEEVGRFATVRQPDSVTVDERTGDLFVGSATGDGLQRIPADQRQRGQ